MAPEASHPSSAGHLSIEAKLRTAFELSPTVLAITTAGEGRFLEVNEAFVRLHGYAREEVIGRTVSELNLWVDARQRTEALASLTAGSPVRNVETRMRTRSGDERVCILNADVVVVDGRTCVLTALTDITDRVRAETALRESEQRFLLAFHANPLPMSITRLDDGRHLEVNEAAVRHSGYTRDEMLARNKAQLGFWVSPEQRDDMRHELHATGRVRDFEVTFQTRAGARRQLLVNSQIMTFGGVPAVLSVSIDITDRIVLEAESRARREEAEALAETLRRADQAKDEFLAMLGHELRNPLGTISTAMALLERAGTMDDARRFIDVVRRQAGQLSRLVDDLLDVSRLTSGKIILHREPVDIHAAARKCIQALAERGQTNDVHIDLEGHAAWTSADPARLEQVVNNLLDNALKYTPARGRVVITTSCDGDGVLLSVRDTGQGIDPELLPRIFDPFVQEPQALDRARGGLGLGLAVVKRLVELHGGTVRAESMGAGRGSTFTMRVPASAPPIVSADMSSVRSPRDGGPPRKILVVEDNADAREMLKTLLEVAGHIVETSEDGPGALEKLETFGPEIALIDVGLPGIDGYAVARKAREQPATRAIRLVAVTGYGLAADRARALAAGFDRHVTKPIDPDALRQLLTSL
jgi:PAS domain S-box-containing protein